MVAVAGVALASGSNVMSGGTQTGDSGGRGMMGGHMGWSDMHDEDQQHMHQYQQNGSCNCPMDNDWNYSYDYDYGGCH